MKLEELYQQTLNNYSQLTSDKPYESYWEFVNVSLGNAIEDFPDCNIPFGVGDYKRTPSEVLQGLYQEKIYDAYDIHPDTFSEKLSPYMIHPATDPAQERFYRDVLVMFVTSIWTLDRQLLNQDGIGSEEANPTWSKLSNILERWIIDNIKRLDKIAEVSQ